MRGGGGREVDGPAGRGGGCREVDGQAESIKSR